MHFDSFSLSFQFVCCFVVDFSFFGGVVFIVVVVSITRVSQK